MTDPDWSIAKLIPFDRPDQSFGAGVLVGLAQAVELLKELPAAVAGTPGYRTALATVDAAAQSKRATEGIRAMRHAARHGVDVTTHVVASDPKGVLVLPMNLVEGAEA